MITPSTEDPERDVVEARADRRRQRDDEEQRGERHRDLGDARDDRVDPAAEVARGRPEQDADDHHEERREDGDLERDLRPVQQAQELVPAERVGGAEHEQRLLLLARERVVVRHVRPRPDGEELVVDRVGADEDLVRPVAEPLLRERRADEGGEDQEDDDDRAADREPVAPQPPPDALPVAARANVACSPSSRRLDGDGGAEAGAPAAADASAGTGRERAWSWVSCDDIGWRDPNRAARYGRVNP